MGKTLLVLPCNPGAMQGDYYKGRGLWKTFGRELARRGLKDQVDIAAVDCIITFLAKDGQGALVHETEMNRVRGFDAYPGQVFSSGKKAKLRLLINDLKIGLDRFADKYDRIVACLNVMPYRMAFRNAVKEKGLGNKVCEMEWPIVGIGVSHNIIDDTIDAILQQEKGIKHIGIDRVCNFKSDENKQEMLRRYALTTSKYQLDLP